MRSKAAWVVTMVLVLAWFAIPAAVCAAADPVEFSADLVITGPDSVSKAKLYVRGETIHRVEMSEESGGVVYLRPPKARGSIWMLDPAKKQYSVLNWPQTHKDPLEAWTDIQYDMRGGVKGEETINGYPCKVFHFQYKGEERVALKMWFADDLKYTIKREADAKIPIESPEKPSAVKGTFEILNIKTGKLDDALFEVPSDFAEVK